MNFQRLELDAIELTSGFPKSSQLSEPQFKSF